MEIYLLILILAVIQSLFGVGILLFGTPILLLLGYEYTEALLYLLPASAALSWSQVKDSVGIKLNGGYRKLFFIICLPMLVLGMMVATSFNMTGEIKVAVICMLVLAFALRTSGKLNVFLQKQMKRNLPFALGSMGLVHGLSNMGGSILTPLVSSVYQDKNKILAAVSFDYAFMASIQLIILLSVNGQSLTLAHLAGPGISLLVRYTIGKRVFSFTSETQYQVLLNSLILVNALLLSINL